MAQSSKASQSITEGKLLQQPQPITVKMLVPALHLESGIPGRAWCYPQVGRPSALLKPSRLFCHRRAQRSCSITQVRLTTNTKHRAPWSNGTHTKITHIKRELPGGLTQGCLRRSCRAESPLVERSPRLGTAPVWHWRRREAFAAAGLHSGSLEQLGVGRQAWNPVPEWGLIRQQAGTHTSREGGLH